MKKQASNLYTLIQTPEYLGLQKIGDEKAKPFYIDFLSKKMRYRCEQASLRKELLARALGKSPAENPVIIDATAGLGRDSFILATLGFHVTMLERSPILFALLGDAIQRAKRLDQAPANRLTLIQADAITWLPTTKPKPDIVYLDPMFPERQKSAAVKKEMTILQDLLGTDTDTDKLFEIALTCGANRVVVKRPRLAENISNRKPTFTLSGKSSRFDVYII